MYPILSKSPVFNGMDEQKISSLLDETQFTIKCFQKNEYLSHHGDPCRSLIILLKGSVRGEMFDISGKALKIEDIEAPRVIAPAFLFGKNAHFPVDIIANNEVEILVFGKEEFIKLMQSEQIILKNYLDIISNRAQFLSKKIKFLSFKTIKEKIAIFFLEQSKGRGRFELHQTQSQLAELFGIAQPSLARALKEMKEEGLIDNQRKTVTIVNRKALMKLLG